MDNWIVHNDRNEETFFSRSSAAFYLEEQGFINLCPKVRKSPQVWRNPETAETMILENYHEYLKSIGY